VSEGPKLRDGLRRTGSGLPVAPSAVDSSPDTSVEQGRITAATADLARPNAGHAIRPAITAIPFLQQAWITAAQVFLSVNASWIVSSFWAGATLGSVESLPTLKSSREKVASLLIRMLSAV